MRTWEQHSIDACDTLGNSLVIGTYQAMSSAPESVALGYYAGGDYIHYSASGRAAFARKCVDLLRAGANRK
jgi:hypothetical protein